MDKAQATLWIFVLGLCGCQRPSSVHLQPDVAAPSARAAPPAATAEARADAPGLTALRVMENAPPQRATAVILGENFGCAQFAAVGSVHFQCWDAPRPGDIGAVNAWPVPWLDDKGELTAALDRVCEFARNALTFRCWLPPKRGDTRGQELPANWQWRDPNLAGSGQGDGRADRVKSVALGGSFACLKSAERGVWCLGDDRFGQLGGSRPVPPPRAPREDPAFVQHIWPADALVAGTWHACALAAPSDPSKGPQIACWGRGDRGQLGVVAKDTCSVDGVKVACAKSPMPGIRLESPSAKLFAGDLFTCASSPDGMKCWGANQDAFFGTPGSCPASLRKAWPTLHGTVAAPRAACSSTPVAVPQLSGFQQDVQLGPRGLCFMADQRLKCLGGVQPPSVEGVSRVVLNPGQYANACGLRDNGVVCWGEGYSAPGTPNVPVAIAFAAMPPKFETAVVRSTTREGWAPSCRIHRGCSVGPRAAAPCAAGLETKNWTELLQNSPKRYADRVVSVRGHIGLGFGRTTDMGCPSRSCCNGVRYEVLLAGSPPLTLDGLSCTGDESQQCCNAPAYGQSVVATGRLQNAESSSGTSWSLAEAELCSE